MTQHTYELALLVTVVGAVVVVALLLKSALERVRVPPLVGYLLLGVVLRTADDAWGVLPVHGAEVFDFLGKLGVIALLFTVGLESYPRHLLGQLRRASPIWIGNIVISGGLGLLVARWMGSDWTTSIIIGTAMTATSVGVPSEVWERNEAIDTEDGQLFVDVAELDDISGVVLLAILFAVLEPLRQLLGGPAEGGGPATDALWAALGTTSALVIGKLLLLAVGCFLFGRFGARHLVRFFERSETGTDVVISITGLGIVIAGLGGMLGFSVAIGAFFAGLALSGERRAVERTRFATLRDLLVPLFFVDIGLSVALGAVADAWPLGLALVAAAIGGKILGTTGPGLPVVGWTSALTLGVAMVPRAEITMIVMHRGLALGGWAVSPREFSATVLTVLATCVAAPPVLQALIRRHVVSDRAAKEAEGPERASA